jgi:hypothetical protein
MMVYNTRNHSLVHRLRLALYTAPYKVDVTPHVKAETEPPSGTLFSSYLEFRTADKVHRPSD